MLDLYRICSRLFNLTVDTSVGCVFCCFLSALIARLFGILYCLLWTVFRHDARGYCFIKLFSMHGAAFVRGNILMVLETSDMNDGLI